MAVTHQTAAGRHLLEAHDSASRADFQRGDMIHYKDKSVVPLAAYVDTKGNQKSAKSDKIITFRGETQTRRIQLTDATPGGGSAGATGTTVTVDDTEDLVVGMICMVQNGLAADGDVEGTLIRITAITAGVDIDYVQLSAGTPATSDFIIPIGYAGADSDTDAPTMTDIEPESVTTYLTLLKRLVSLTITERDSATYAGGAREDEKIARARMEFMRTRELNFWFSRATTHVGSNAVRTSMGIFNQLAATAGVNGIDGGAAVLDDTMLGNAIFTGAKFYDDTEFTCFHGAVAGRGLFVLGVGKSETSVKDTRYGFRAQGVDVAQYRVNFLHSQAFDIVGDPWTSMAIGLDLDSLTNWYLQGEGQMRLKRNVDPKSAAAGETIKHLFRAQEGVSVTVPERHWYIENLA